jgi:Xaa-Pro aminopeptidase
VEAEIQHSFLSQRATGPAYGSILASGESACTLHYISNNQECKDGDMMLMDFGAEYGGYNADLTRTVPVMANSPGDKNRFTMPAFICMILQESPETRYYHS